MHRILSHIKIAVPEQVYLKNPDSTDIGQNIIEQSILMIDKLGFEAYTFKKLGEKIGSPESTIYRYFENKHMLLIYLISWYWSWMEYRVVLSTVNVDKPDKRLAKALETITHTVKDDTNFTHISESRLQKIVVAESAKAFLTKAVDKENKAGYFVSYQRLTQRLAALIQETDPQFTYPKTLVTTILEGYHQQRFFREHLSALSDCVEDENMLTHFYNTLTFSLLQNGE